MEQGDIIQQKPHKVAGIVRGIWSFNEKVYFTEALEFYDEVIFIDPRQVSYRFERGSETAAVEYHGRLLNDLSMLYTFGYAEETALLAKTLKALGCPVSDPFHTITRDSLGKIPGALDFFQMRSGTTTHLLTSYAAAQHYFTHLGQEHYPILYKPFMGNKGKGIVALNNAAEGLALARKYFRRGKQFLMLEKQMIYLREWRLYVIDGEVIEAYERQKAEGQLTANIHQGGHSLKVDPAEKEELFEFVRTHLPQGYETGIFGVDLAVTDKGEYHIVEINRTPGFAGFKHITHLSFPRLAHERLVRRARPVAVPAPPAYVITFLGDSYPGETYQLRREQKGHENILKTRGYDYGVKNFSALLECSDYTVANLEAVLTTERRSSLRKIKPYLDWSDPVETPALLQRMGVNVVSLANNHSMDFGAAGLEESLLSLKRTGIDVIGAGLNEQAASEVVHHRFTVGDESFHIIIASGFEFRANHVTWGYYADEDKAGVNPWARAKARAQMHDLREAYPEALIVAFPHWGSNYSFKAERQALLAASLAGGGADLVIGHGAHIMQEIERYRGKWIVYSLGNFVYNSPGRFAQHDKIGYGMITRMLFNRDKSIWLRFYPILTDNNATDYQSRFVTKEEFDHIVPFLLPYQKGKKSGMENYLSAGKDEHGLYLTGKVR